MITFENVVGARLIVTHTESLSSFWLCGVRHFPGLAFSSHCFFVVRHFQVLQIQRPRHIVSASAGVLWTAWPCVGVTSVHPVRTVSVRSVWQCTRKSPQTWPICGVPQGSVLGPILHCVSKKGTPMLSIVTLKRINGFQRFLAQIFQTQLAIKR